MTNPQLSPLQWPSIWVSCKTSCPQPYLAPQVSPIRSNLLCLWHPLLTWYTKTIRGWSIHPSTKWDPVIITQNEDYQTHSTKKINDCKTFNAGWWHIVQATLNQMYTTTLVHGKFIWIKKRFKSSSKVELETEDNEQNNKYSIWNR